MKTILNKINKANHIALFTHCNADLDAYGSTGAIYHFIKGLGKKVSIFLCEEIDPAFNIIFCLPHLDIIIISVNTYFFQH